MGCLLAERIKKYLGVFEGMMITLLSPVKLQLTLLTGYLKELGVLEYVETWDGPTAKTPSLISHSESIILMNKNNNEIYAEPFIKVNLEVNSNLKEDSKYKITELKKCLIMR